MRCLVIPVGFRFKFVSRSKTGVGKDAGSPMICRYSVPVTLSLFLVNLILLNPSALAEMGAGGVSTETTV